MARKWVRDCEAYWGFQGSCLESLRAARQRGIIAVAEFATGHVIRAIDLLSAEAYRHPEWAGTISNFAFPDWYRERLELEPHAADVCIAASRFTIASLQQAGVDSRKNHCVAAWSRSHQVSIRRPDCDVDRFGFCLWEE